MNVSAVVFRGAQAAAGAPFGRKHSHFERCLLDTAAGGQEPLIHRFFCPNDRCGKRTFAGTYDHGDVDKLLDLTHPTQSPSTNGQDAALVRDPG